MVQEGHARRRVRVVRTVSMPRAPWPAAGKSPAATGECAPARKAPGGSGPRRPPRWPRTPRAGASPPGVQVAAQIHDGKVPAAYEQLRGAAQAAGAHGPPGPGRPGRSRPGSAGVGEFLAFGNDPQDQPSGCSAGSVFHAVHGPRRPGRPAGPPRSP
jgi:hypothetical protein